MKEKKMMMMMMMIIIIIIIIECEKSDTSNNRGDWIHFKITRQYLSNIKGKHEMKELQ